MHGLEVDFLGNHNMKGTNESDELNRQGSPETFESRLQLAKAGSGAMPATTPLTELGRSDEPAK